MAPTPDTERKRAFGLWLDGVLTRRALRNRDLAALLKQAGAGERWSAATISEWRGGKTAPTETAALYIAKALSQSGPFVSGPFVLRQAGHGDAADLIEEMPRENDPRVARIRRSGLSPVAQDEAEEFSRRQDRQKDELIDEYVRLLKRGEQLEQEEQRQTKDPEADDSAVS